MTIPEELNVLRSRCPDAFRPPATQSAIGELETHLDCRLPPDVIALYGDYDGNTPELDVDFRLMSVAEVVECHKKLLPIKQELRVFWTDDNSNYGAVYVSGPLEGKIRIIFHDSDELVLYHSIVSFYGALLRAAEAEEHVLDLPPDVSAEETQALLEQSDGRRTRTLIRLAAIRSSHEPETSMDASGLRRATLTMLQRLEEVVWFSAVGAPIDDPAVETVRTWKEAIRSIKRRQSENAGLEANNILHSTVARRGAGQDWNVRVERIKARMMPLVQQKISRVVEDNQLPKAFENHVVWDVLGVCLEQEYADIVAPDLYEECAEWYLRGHFPCGWKGQFPESGRLVVF